MPPKTAISRNFGSLLGGPAPALFRGLSLYGGRPRHFLICSWMISGAGRASTA